LIDFAGDKSVNAGPAGEGGVVEAGRKEVLSLNSNQPPKKRWFWRAAEYGKF
jgi:hypothetical protein